MYHLDMGGCGIRLGFAAAALLLGGAAYGAGSTAMDAFNFVTGARAAGMGGAATAAVDDPTALQWNPAALDRVARPSLVLSHLFWVADINYTYAGFSMPLPLGTAGVSLQALNYGPIESTRGLAAAVDASDFGLTAGGALAVLPGIRAGASVKFFRHALAGSGVNEGAVDVGGIYDVIPDKVGLGLVVQNVGYAGKLEGEAPPLPTTVKMGLAYLFSMTPEAIPVYGRESWSPSISVLMAGDVSVYQRGEPAYFSAGVEGVLADIVSARAGYLQSLRTAGSGAGISMGMGVKAFGFRLDYAFGLVGDLGNGQYVTLSWVPAREEQPRPQQEAQVAPPVSATETVPAKPTPAEVEAEYSAGMEAYNGGNYAEAVKHGEKAVQADPSHWGAWQLLGNCRYAQGDRTSALEAYRHSLAANPGNSVLKSFADQLEKELSGPK